MQSIPFPLLALHFIYRNLIIQYSLVYVFLR